jgi:hypothetical protein
MLIIIGLVVLTAAVAVGVTAVLTNYGSGPPGAKAGRPRRTLPVRLIAVRLPRRSSGAPR